MVFKAMGIHEIGGGVGGGFEVTKRRIAYKGSREDVGRELRGKPRECGAWKPREECVSLRKEQSAVLSGGVR